MQEYAPQVCAQRAENKVAKMIWMPMMQDGLRDFRAASADDDDAISADTIMATPAK